MSLLALPAHALAARLRAGDLSARELLEAHLAHIAAHGPALNALCVLDADGARARADAADRARAEGRPLGPLHGVPVSIKDLWDVAGLPTTYGMKELAGHVPARDAAVVARLRAAGAVILGKSNVPELGFDWQTVSPVYGRTANPWDPSRTCGGSSGGAAAAVAAGFSALDVGSDLGGSIRVPAHMCGVYGLKATEHRIPATGHCPVPGTLRGMRHGASFGPIARSLDDLRLVLPVLAGPDGHDWETPPVGLAPAPRPAGPWRIAWSDEIGLPVSEETRTAVAALAGRLAEAGATVVRAMPEAFDAVQLITAWGHLVGAELGSCVSTRERLLGRTAITFRMGRSPLTRALVQGMGDSLRSHVEALMARDAAIAMLEQFFADFDAWVLPVASVAAFPHQKTGGAIRVDDLNVPYTMACGGHAVPFVLTGQPVVALPAGRTRDGLPIGVQVVGPRWSEPRLLDVAAFIDGEAQGWAPSPVLAAA